MDLILHSKFSPVLLTWFISSALSVIFVKMTGASLYAELPQLVLKLLLTVCCFPTLGVWLCISGYSEFVKHIMIAAVVVSVALMLLVAALVLLALAISMGIGFFFFACLLIAGLLALEDQGRREQTKEFLQQMKTCLLHQLNAFSDKLWPWAMEHPAETCTLLTWLLSSSSSVIFIRLTGASFKAELPRLVLKLLLVASLLPSLGVWCYVSSIFNAKVAAKKEEKLVQDMEVRKAKTSPAIIKSSLSMQQLKDFKPSSHVTSRTVKTTALSAAGGAITLGTGGGILGLTGGGAIGAACGVLPAFFTFGLSIPIGAALGGSVGWATGVTVGGTAGALGGGAAGLTYTRLVPEKTL
eukprot:CAMPEP_0197651946 /NCGR_PEP_ID=MMETSP1338-20131121/34150_1 /TAXON_ID=43686 ORGANISM="Pelagodinium beii, Strain RCC1491" /NCGR_SAMPLE_ID=MMETSP1338 /ASSEMBLY_ACC=CAM_ASM_000754 /LENGTH=353 /DNA_ID=CAMNT_0043226719 /DNA_START=158 /DNA_END=1219 /DNA_ORIENTATION=-